MKLKYPIEITQGNTLAQAAKKTGDSKAAALIAISTAATKNRAAGIHQDLREKIGRGKGPYMTPPAGIIVEGAGKVGPCAGIPTGVPTGIPTGIALGTLVLKQVGHKERSR